MWRWLPVVLLLLARDQLAQAANSQSERKQPAAELNAFGGGISTGSHYAAGGGFTIEIRQYITGAFEFTYAGAGLDEISKDYQYADTISRSASRTLIAEFAAHLQFANARARVVPYLSAGVGIVNSRMTLTNTRFGQTYTTPVHAEQTAGAIGGGLRCYVTRAFGILPEIRAYTTSRPFVRIGLGIFYRWQ